MADAEIEKTQAVISIDGMSEYFVANGEVVKFDGFLRVYKETENDADQPEGDAAGILPQLTVGESLHRNTIVATQRFAQRPIRYNEASLVRKLEELGIGRPSTYAATITTIQQREYVTKGDKVGEERTYQTLTLKGDKITCANHKTTIGAERGKLIPTDTGIVVNDYLSENFPSIMDYNFTADIEKEFDEIAEGKMEWTGVIRQFYNDFDPLVESAGKAHTEHKVGERLLGNDPKTGEPVTVKIGRFGPVAQIGSSDADSKPRFAQLKKSQTLESITLEEALELFRLPRELGKYLGKTVSVGAGKYGPYVVHNGTYVSIPKDTDPLKITFEEAVIMIHRKHIEEEERHLKKFEGTDMEILNGRYGPYIVYNGNNYRLPKNLHDRVKDLTEEECMQVIEGQAEKAARHRK
jgi:DNA topoisomerase-1